MDPKEYKKIYNKISSNIKEELNTRVANIVKELKKTNFKHKDIHKRVEKSKEQILEVNKELSGKISDLKNVHEWNKYTIAFFGETNAGKSTVIEALRISLKENLKAKEYKEFEKIVAKKEILDTTIIKTKAKKDFYKDKNKLFYGILFLFIGLKYWLLQNRERRILKKLAKFKDGEIIGTGIQDFTQSCIDYNFSHNGKEYTLIDVPGIEGNEGKYEDMILQAVSRAHTVFYVVSGKIPESGTVQKIKKYLKQQAEVYCIINERRNKYFPEDAQKSFQELHYNEQFTQEVNQKMQEVLGGFYKGSVTVQALLAFYGVSKTIPYSRNEKYIKNKSKLLTIFDKEEKLVEKSNISSIANLILTELNNTDVKIYNINIDKIVACIDFFAMKVKEVRDENYSDHLLDEIGKQVNNANNSISKVPNSLMNNLRASESSIISSAFRECEQEIYGYVDKYKIKKDTFKKFCESTIERTIKRILESYRKEVERFTKSEIDRINNELKRLGDRVNSLQTSFSSINVSSQLEVEIPSINLKEVVSFVGGVAAWVSGGALLGSIIPGVGNVVGAIIGGIVGLIVQGVKALFGGESKEAKIKRKVSEELEKLKTEVTQKIGELKFQIVTQFENDIVLPIIEQNKQIVIRYKSLQNLFNENINFLKTQKNSLENEKHRHY
ncbi:dynamin family protein [Capnocytophaga gingivalis]